MRRALGLGLLAGRTRQKALAGVFVLSVVASALLMTNSFAATQPNAGVLSGLLSQYDITATPMTASFTPATSQAQAVATAQKYLAAISSGTSSTMLVQFTNPTYGPSNGGGGVTPIVVNEPVWLIIQPNVSFPILGPPGYNGPSTYTATAVEVVDAMTGNYIEGLSLS